jgi:hypothetical protein
MADNNTMAEDEVPLDIVNAFEDADQRPSGDLRVVPAPDWMIRAGPPDFFVELNADTDAETRMCSYPKTPIVSKTPVSWEAISTSKCLMGLYETKPPKGTCVRLPKCFPESTAQYVVPILELYGALGNDETRDEFEKYREETESSANAIFDKCVHQECREEFQEADNKKRETMFQVCNVLQSLENAMMEDCLLHAGKIQSDKLNELVGQIDAENEEEGMKKFRSFFFFNEQPDSLLEEEDNEDLDKLEKMAETNSGGGMEAD